jgi:predicted dehydrogenase
VNTNHFSRREFLGIGAAAAGASLVGERALAHSAGHVETLPEPPLPRAGAAERVRFGMIGVGMQGAPLLRESIALPDVECAVACDLYDGRHTLAREIAGAELPVTRRYQQLLDDRSIQAVVVAVPDHWHRQIFTDAIAAGKDVYCEKPMSHNAADGVAMLDAAKKSDRVVQIGSQRVSSPLYGKARDMIAQGMLGDLMIVEGWLGRNDPSGAWQYPPPLDLSPQNLDWDTWLGRAPKKPFDPITFARWRAWKEYGTGVAGDLLVHLVSGMIAMLPDLNRPPTRVMSLGGIRRWKDGRNMPDVHAALFEYAGLPVYLRLNLGTAMPDAYRIQGSKGLLELSGNTITFTPQPGRDTSPSYYANASFPRAMREEYQRRWMEENGARAARDQMAETLTIRGGNANELRLHLANFFDGVRTRKPTVEDASFGHHAALACHMANESYFRARPVTWDEASRTVKG